MDFFNILTYFILLTQTKRNFIFVQPAGLGCYVLGVLQWIFINFKNKKRNFISKSKFNLVDGKLIHNNDGGRTERAGRHLSVLRGL